MTKVSFFALGGQDEKGKNCYILEVGDDIYMIDSGVKNPVVSTLGIDTIIPNYEYIKTHMNNFKGLFISSGHDHSIAAIPWLLMQVKNVKIYTSPFIKKIIEDRISKYQIQNKSYEIISLTDDLLLGNVRVKSFSLASSMPNTIGFNFQTPQGDIMYMSTFVLNTLVAGFGETNLEQIKRTISDNGLLALAIDSGTANYHGYANEKAKIRPLIEEKIKSHDKNSRVIIAGYDEEMATLQEVLQIAIDYNRPVALYGRSYATYLSEFTAMFPETKLPRIIENQDIQNTKDVIVLVTGTGQRLYQRIDRIAENRDVFLKLNNSDLVIVVAPPINGHEKFASRAEDKVAEITWHLVDIPRENFYQANPADQDIQKTLEVLKPKYILPIRGLYCYLSIVTKLAVNCSYLGDKVIILQNGKKAIFDNKELESQNTIVKNTREIIIDGFGIGDIAPSVISERENLAMDGVIIITILINKSTKRVEGNILIKSMGVVHSTKEAGFNELFSEKIKSYFDDDSLKERWNYGDIQADIRKMAQKIARKQIQKEPITVINIFEN